METTFNRLWHVLEAKMRICDETIEAGHYGSLNQPEL